MLFSHHPQKDNSLDTEHPEFSRHRSLERINDFACPSTFKNRLGQFIKLKAVYLAEQFVSVIHDKHIKALGAVTLDLVSTASDRRLIVFVLDIHALDDADQDNIIRDPTINLADQFRLSRYACILQVWI